jgi:hypothetical protein
MAYVSRHQGESRRRAMSKNALESFIEGVRLVWGPLTSELIGNCHDLIEALVKALPPEAWLAELHRELPETKELYRDPEHGFMLLVHAESRGRYRAPHDHGRGWVIYAVQQGEMEIGTYMRTQGPDGRVRLVRRETYRVRPGEARVYLPGDIHDTRCTADSVLYYRFTDRDLKKDEAEGYPVTRYIEQDGVWTVRA